MIKIKDQDCGQNTRPLSSSRFSLDSPKSVTAMWPLTSSRRLRKIKGCGKLDELFRRNKTSALFRFQVPVDDSNRVEVVECQRQLSQVELDVLLGEHDLKEPMQNRQLKGYSEH